jgi:hypothetical protein
MSLGAFSRCLRSECSGIGSDSDCGAGKSCVYVGRLEGGIYRCRAVGIRTAGDFCTEGTSGGVENRCGAGQTCAGGLCMPGICTSNGDCPKGAICAAVAGGIDHKQCVPFCVSDDDCAGGISCIKLPSGGAMCAQYTKAECLRSGCPVGQICAVDQQVAWDLQASCQSSCTPGDPASCAAGHHCAVERSQGGQARCARTCQPGPDACPKNQTCGLDGSGGFSCRARAAPVPPRT